MIFKILWHFTPPILQKRLFESKTSERNGILPIPFPDSKRSYLYLLNKQGESDP
jgi:hypothetical protein